MSEQMPDIKEAYQKTMEFFSRLNEGVMKISLLEDGGRRIIRGTPDIPYLVEVPSDEEGGYIEVTVNDEDFFPATPDELRQKVNWICKMKDEGCVFTAEDAGWKAKRIQFAIPKKLCGSATGWCEGFVHRPSNTTPYGFFVKGRCQPAITKLEWRRYHPDHEGSVVDKNEKFQFEQTLELQIQTEGLNGDWLTVEFYTEDGNFLDTVRSRTYGGVLILIVPLSNLWRSKFFNWYNFGWGSKTVKVIVNYTDFKGQAQHANFDGITIENEQSETKSTKDSVVPVTVGKAEITPQNYLPCKYDKIVIFSKDRKDYVFFDPKEKDTSGQGKPYEVVAGANNGKKRITIADYGLKTARCVAEVKHANNIFVYDKKKLNNWIVYESDKKLTLDAQYDYPEPRVEGKSTAGILKDYAQGLTIPVEYIWPAREGLVQEYTIGVNSCRYKKDVHILVYPEIKWSLAASFKKAGELAYIHANMPPGNIAKKHQEIAQETGYDTWYIGEHKKNRVEAGLGLAAEWDNHEAKLGTDFKPKIELFVNAFKKAYAIAERVKQGAGGKMKASNVPAAFAIMAPAVEVAISWQVAAPKEGRQVAVEGNLDFKASPLVGAKLIIDLLAAGSNLNPAAQIIYTSLSGLVEDLSDYITFTLKFYGQLDVEFNALKVNSLTGVDGGKSTIAGKMGLLLDFQLTVEGKIEYFKKSIKYGFIAEASSHAYFGGDFTIDTDEQGIFTKPVLKFSGLVIKAKAEGYFGKWKRTIKLEDENGDPVTVVDKEEMPLEKKYIT